MARRGRGRRARRNGGSEGVYIDSEGRHVPDITDDLNRLVNSNREVGIDYARNLANRYGDTRTGDVVRRIQ